MTDEDTLSERAPERSHPDSSNARARSDPDGPRDGTPEGGETSTRVPWHALEAAEVLEGVDVDPQRGLPAAVEEGRVVFENVRKVTFFLLSTGVAAIAAILYSLASGIPLPFLPAQLLWLNVVTNGLQDVALAFEPGERDVLDRPPRHQEEPVISALLWERTAFTGLIMAIGSMLMFHWALGQEVSLEGARTVALTTMVIFMAFHVGNARSERRSLFRLSPLSNPFLLAATAGALIMHALALEWGFTQFVLRVEPLEAGTWLMMAAVASSVILVSELHKLLRHEPWDRSSETWAKGRL